MTYVIKQIGECRANSEKSVTSLQAEDERSIPDVRGNIETSMQEDDKANLKKRSVDDENIDDDQIPDAVVMYLVKNLEKESTSKFAWAASSSTRKKNMTEKTMQYKLSVLRVKKQRISARILRKLI